MMRRGLSLVVALLLAAVAVPAPRPAFLDSFTEVRVGLEQPLTTLEMRGRFRVRVDGAEVPIRRVSPAGAPQQARALPQRPGRVILAGTIQQALGGNAWDPDGELTQATETRPGVHELTVALPKGRWEYKVTRNGSWAENYGQNFQPGGDNLALDVPKDGTVVRFVVDFNRRTLRNSLEHPTEVTAPAVAPPLPQRSGPTRFPTVVLTLERPLSPEQVDDAMEVEETGVGRRTLVAREVLSLPAFRFDGWLGSRWSAQGTQFRVWSPPSRRADLLLFDQATGGEARVVPMARNRNGVWEAHVEGDLHGRFYVYRFESYGETRTATDINAFAASPDSRRTMVIDFNRANPPGWPSQPKLRHRHQTDAVIYELHVRDFTVRPDSGVRPAARGKYAGLSQRGTRTPRGKKTGLDYLVDLGVTDIHLLPIHNFLTGSPDEYTWGYATNLFNVVEETYAVDRNDPVAVVREFKEMVQSMHRAGLRVVLDVVYNHTWPPEGADSNFWQTVPYYYFRTNDRGDVLNESGVGNAMADERPMVRKFVRDSLLFWMDEYKIDGFRFDLIGMHTPEAIRDWSRAMHARRPDVLLYGEPWTGGGPTRTGKGAQRGSGVAVFNDRFRGVFRGELDGAGPGFLTGGGGSPFQLEKAVSGWIDGPNAPDGFTDSPEETINYVSAHDNMTLWDRLGLSLPKDRPELLRASVRLTQAVVLLSQGVPFLEGGAQIGRTKGGNRNSYNAGDAVNAYDWTRAEEYAAENDYVRGLIALRRAHPAFRLATADAVRKALKVVSPGPTPFAFTLDHGGREYLVLFHGGTERGTYTLPTGKWDVLATGRRASATPIGAAVGVMNLEPLSAYVLVRR